MASSIIYTDIIFEKGAQILAISVHIFKEMQVSNNIDLNIDIALTQNPWTNAAQLNFRTFWGTCGASTLLSKAPVHSAPTDHRAWFHKSVVFVPKTFLCWL